MIDNAQATPSSLQATPLYPSLEPFNTGMIEVGDGHSLYWEECGNPDGPAVVFLHGGPGAGCSPTHRRFFDPDYWRVVLFDQRGCGRSRPEASLKANTTQHIIDDMEHIRNHLGIDQWVLFGGSWGSLLAMAYAIEHPDHSSGLILRGVFLGDAAELHWFLHDMGRFFPDARARFVEFLPEEERHDLLGGYHRRLIHTEPAIHQPAAGAWSAYETACARLNPMGSGSSSRGLGGGRGGGGSRRSVGGEGSRRSVGGAGGAALSLARIEAHYFVNNMFLPPRWVLDHLDRLGHLRCHMVQGRYDVICPPSTAYKLAAAWPGATLQIINDAGHSAFEAGIQGALVAATNQFRR